MRRIRSHVDVELVPGRTIALPADSRAHLTRVLRLREGDRVTLFNGDGHDYPARLQGSGNQCAAEVLAQEPAAAPECRLQLSLVQALARGEKMDWIIQKATELGVATIVPVSSQRSEVRLDGERAEKRLAHWRKVAISACEQSGRARIPTIAPPMPLHNVAATIAAPLRLLLDPDGERGLADLDLVVDAVAIAVGPEGGFEPHEIDLLNRAGWQRVRLGDRVLRTETAGLAAISAVLALTGEL
jgi:16S rRNA (uracil1498-N3)-methyltransferase